MESTTAAYNVTFTIRHSLLKFTAVPSYLLLRRLREVEIDERARARLGSSLFCFVLVLSPSHPIAFHLRKTSLEIRPTKPRNCWLLRLPFFFLFLRSSLVFFLVRRRRRRYRAGRRLRERPPLEAEQNRSPPPLRTIRPSFFVDSYYSYHHFLFVAKSFSWSLYLFFSLRWIP